MILDAVSEEAFSPLLARIASTSLADPTLPSNFDAFYNRTNTNRLIAQLLMSPEIGGSAASARPDLWEVVCEKLRTTLSTINAEPKDADPLVERGLVVKASQRVDAAMKSWSHVVHVAEAWNETDLPIELPPLDEAAFAGAREELATRFGSEPPPSFEQVRTAVGLDARLDFAETQMQLSLRLFRLEGGRGAEVATALRSAFLQAQAGGTEGAAAVWDAERCAKRALARVWSLPDAQSFAEVEASIRALTARWSPPRAVLFVAEASSRPRFHLRVALSSKGEAAACKTSFAATTGRLS